MSVAEKKLLVCQYFDGKVSHEVFQERMIELDIEQELNARIFGNVLTPLEMADREPNPSIRKQWYDLNRQHPHNELVGKRRKPTTEI